LLLLAVASCKALAYYLTADACSSLPIVLHREPCA
jgi:hypothetical protein